MELSLPVVWSDDCLLHEPGAEIWVGVSTPAAETPSRAEAIRGALDARVVEAEPHADDALLEVHDPELLAYLASAWQGWELAGLPEDPGQNRVVPYVFGHAALGARRPAAAVWAKPGWFAYGTMTLVGPGTWVAVRAAVNCALTAVDLVLAGEPGSAKGGIAIAIAHELGLPVKVIGIGEGIDDLRPFDPKDSARALVGEA